jgi:uncharacterized protein YndB with AHSA1/START domain
MTYPIGDPFSTARAAAPARAIQASIEIAAPPDVVFRALADPHELVAWLGEAPPQSPSRAPLDAGGEEEEHGEATSPSSPVAHPRSGAAWLAHVRAPDGMPGTVSGAFVSVVPPRSLTTTWSASWNQFVRDEVTFELTAIDLAGVAGTHVTVTHRRRDDAHPHLATTGSAHSAAENRGDAWAGLLARLATYVATTNALSYYGIGSDDVAQAFGALHRRVVAIHQGDSV